MLTNIYKLGQRLAPIAAAICLSVSPYSAMAEKHDHEMEKHGSHDHGVARLTIATTDDGLEIMLESPAANIFGFEHKAKSEAEHEAVDAAVKTLKNGASLFTVNEAAACKLEKADVESAMADGEHEHDDHDKEEKHDDHDKEEKHAKHEGDDHGHEKEEKHAKHEDDDHGHEKKDKHDDHDKEEKHAKHEDDDHGHEKEEKYDEHAHDDHAEKEDSHSDVEAMWAYHCDKPGAIETVTVKLFSAFPQGFKEIDTEWITATGAGKVELAEDGKVNLTK